MKLLIVAATEGEIKPLPASPDRVSPLALAVAQGRRCTVEILITGVGMVATAYTLTKHLQANKYDFIIQAGVGGSYDRSIALGDVIFVTSDQFGDLGAEDHGNYLDIFEMGLLNKNTNPFSNGKLQTPLFPIHRKLALPRASGLTINTVSGNEQTIERRTAKYNCQVESMEGAAFHYVCLQENIPFAQIRAISNYVAPRDKSQWKMKEAIVNLNNWLVDFVEHVD